MAKQNQRGSAILSGLIDFFVVAFLGVSISSQGGAWETVGIVIVVAAFPVMAYTWYKVSSRSSLASPTPPASGSEHLHKLRTMPYEEYLQTWHWKLKREEKLRAVDNRCQLCNSGSGILEVHHRTYERLGEELNEDLTVLCRLCHKSFHEHRRLES